MKNLKILIIKNNMKKVIILAMGLMFLFVGSVDAGYTCDYVGMNTVCGYYCQGIFYENKTTTYLECIKEQERLHLEVVKKAEERAEQARKEEEAKIRAIVKDELGYSDLVKDSQELIRENTLLKTDNARLERDNFDLGKRVSLLEGLIERQRNVIDLFKTLLNRLKAL